MKQKVCCKGTLGRECTCAHPAGDDDNEDNDDDVTEEVGRECTCAHPGEGEPTGGELLENAQKCPRKDCLPEFNG